MRRPAAPARERARQAASGSGSAIALLRDPVAFARLVEIATRLQRRRDAVVDRWAELYRSHFGEHAFFAEDEFRAFFGAELDTVLQAIVTGDPERVTAELARSGRELQAMGAPFSELVASLHLFEESCLRQLDPADAETSLAQHRVLDRLSHVRIATLAEAFVSERDEEHETRAAALERGLAKLYRDQMGRDSLGELVGRSLPMQVLYERLRVAAKSDAPVLLVGESGTGKELAARAVHSLSRRRSGRFVAVNCAALTASLLESELFGHRKGAFTGAESDATGLLRHAHGGTLFLDEVTEMAPEAQAKLLRAIQEKTVRPIGELTEVASDFRVVASSNRPPDRAVAEGRLRQDLLYRLRTFLVEMPPLRARKDDLPRLARAILERAGLASVTLSDAALRALSRRSWPGNVRELEGVLLAAAAAAPREVIRAIDLPRLAQAIAPAADPLEAGEPVETLRDAERDLVERALLAAGGNKRQAAKQLGVSRKWLYARLPRRG